MATFEGFIDSPRLCSVIQSILLATEAEFAMAQEISSMRSLQEEQDEAYRLSVAADLSKRQKQREASSSMTNDQVNTVIEPSQSKTDPCVNDESLIIRVQQAKDSISAEPSATETNVCKVQFVLPDSTRLVRKFSSDCSVKVEFNCFHVIF